MTSWEQVNAEVDSAVQTFGLSGVDVVRRKKLREFSEYTRRPAILYAADMFNTGKVQAARGETSILLGDKDGFREALNGIRGEKIDIIIQSPGGSPEATESLVKLLRSKFTDIRFIVPSVAKSAATMFAMSGNKIILGDDAELGPTDPQIVINGIPNPAHAVLEQFNQAKKEITQNNSVLSAWMPILQQYGPSLLTVCNNAIKLSVSLVKEWLAIYMLAGERRARSRATLISKYLSGNKHLSHNRSINIQELQSKGVKISFARENDGGLADLILAIHYSVLQTFTRTGAYKIFENHAGKGYYQLVQVIPLPPPQQQA